MKNFNGSVSIYHHTNQNMVLLKFMRQHLLFTLIVVFGLLSLVMGILVFGDEAWGNWYYIRIFVPVNSVGQSVAHFVPTPFYLVFLLLLMIFIAAEIMAAMGMPWRTKLKRWLLFLSSGMILLVSLFYWMWGYNYGRTTIGKSFFGNDYVEMDTTVFKRRWALQTNRVNSLRETVVMPDSDAEARLTMDLTAQYHQVVHKIPSDFHLETALRPQCKEFIPQGLLLRLNTAGFYFPFGSESYVDKALHLTQKPAVIAHELAHGYGVTDEGEANFVGYLICQASGNPLAQYSSALMLWLYMASDGRHLDADFTQSMWDNLSPAVWIDLDERRTLDDKYPEFMPKIRDAIYDSYLSVNRVEGGMKSYNRFVKMVLTYENMDR